MKDNIGVKLVNNPCDLLLLFVLQDPVKDGESKIKADFNDLHERMQTAFRNLEEF